MEFKTKYLPIANEVEGYNMIEYLREIYGNDMADKIKIIYERSFNNPIYEFGTDHIIEYDKTSVAQWYLELPEEIIIKMNI